MCVLSNGFLNNGALTAERATSPASTCFDPLSSWVHFPVKTTQRTKTTLGGREGGLLSERQTRALAAHMNGIWGDPPPHPPPFTQLHCQRLPMATGTRGEPDASCDVSGPDAHWLHRRVTLMIGGAFQRAEPCEALEAQKNKTKNQNLRRQNPAQRRARKVAGKDGNHCLRATTTREKEKPSKQKAERERGRGDWISISFIISLA